MADIGNFTALVEHFTVTEAIDVVTPMALFLLGMVIYSIFIFKFYRFLGRRDTFKLDLHKYNKATLGFIRKIFASILYVIEYIIIMPLFTFFWFVILTVLLVFLSKEQAVENILLVSGAVVASVRVTAYYDEDLSKDLAKMLPFALLGVFLVDISFFSASNSWELIKLLPGMWKIMAYYLLFIIALEFILRISHGIYSVFVPEKMKKKEEE